MDGAVCHVVNRGNGRQEVFHKPTDFVELVGEAKGVFRPGCKLVTNFINFVHLKVNDYEITS